MRKTNVVYKTLANEIYPSLARKQNVSLTRGGFVDIGPCN